VPAPEPTLSPEVGRERIRRRWAELLGAPGGLEHPLYAQLADRAASDDRLVDPILIAPADQQRPNLLLAAIHRLVLDDPDHPLARWYPTARWLAEVGGIDASPTEVPTRHALAPGGADAVVSFVGAEADRLSALMGTRATQTNEIGRSAPLALGLSHVARGADAGVGLIDVGCAAGLNLLVDQVRIELGEVALGDPSSSVLIRSEVRGHLGSVALAPIVWRRGLDARPLAAADDDDALWLLACQWPDDLERFERTRRALCAARRSPLELVQGDLIDDLEPLIESAPDGAHLVIFHSWVAAYLSARRQEALAARIRSIGESRSISWLWLEHPREVPGLAPPRLAGTRIAGASLLVLEEPPGASRALAQCHPHGSWIAPEP
jgi:hypothetical protein